MSKIDIILATHNRSMSLKETLDSLLIQDYSGPFTHEILIIDNNSTDNTKSVIQSYEHKFPKKSFKYMFEGRQGKSFALNTAITATNGNIIVFIDDDVILRNDWLQNIHTLISTCDFDAATGRVLPKYPANVPDWVKDNIDILSGPIVSYDYGEHIKPYDGQSMNPLIGANMIVKRELFNQIGLFNTSLGPGAGTFGDDTEISIRWEKNNKKLYYAGSVVVWHPATEVRMTLNYIANWNEHFGKYSVIKNKGVIDHGIICYEGVPRYLFRELLEQLIKLTLFCFNKRKFLTHWIGLFRSIGTIKMYRKYYLTKHKGT